MIEKICPKCGTIGMRPTYKKEVFPFSEEMLEWRCLRCGYTELNPCLDVKNKKSREASYREKIIAATQGVAEKEW